MARTLKLLGLLLVFLIVTPAFAQTSCTTTYTAACVGQPVCFSVGTTSINPIPANLYRKFLFIDNAGTAPVGIAFGPQVSGPGSPLTPNGFAQPTPTPVPIVATYGQNTIILPGQTTWQIGPVSSGQVGSKAVPTGSIAFVTSSGTTTVCAMEQ
jgi:hypothetical protein